MKSSILASLREREMNLSEVQCESALQKHEVSISILKDFQAHVTKIAGDKDFSANTLISDRISFPASLAQDWCSEDKTCRLHVLYGVLIQRRSPWN